MTEPSEPHDDFVVRSDSFTLSQTDLDGDVFGFRTQVEAGGSARLSSSDAAVIAAAIAALDGWAEEVQLVPPGVEPLELADGGVTLAVDAGVAPSHTPAPHRGPPTRWVLYTSGTTGEPKAIVHTLATLSRTITTSASRSLVWGLTYDPNRMAGIQVILQAIRGGGQLVAPPADATLRERLVGLAEAGVTAVSATPSVWRQALQLPTTQDWELEQITLGGEIADQRILDALATSFPGARIVHVFASTETGAAFSVNDGREGFPAAFLDDAPRGVRLDVRAGILHVHSPGVSSAGADGFASTGDVVEIIDDRVIFRGRNTGMINIGGSNVWPETVETLLRSHPDVLEAVVEGRPNPMTGHVLVASVSLRPSADPDGISKRLRKWVRERAPRTHVPATVSVVDDVAVSATGKVER